MDVETLYDGILAAIILEEGETAHVGAPIGLLAETAEEIAKAKAKAVASSCAFVSSATPPPPPPSAAADAAVSSLRKDAYIISPPVQNSEDLQPDVEGFSCELPDEYASWMGKIQPLSSFQQGYLVSMVCYNDEISEFFKTATYLRLIWSLLVMFAACLFFMVDCLQPHQVARVLRSLFHFEGISCRHNGYICLAELLVSDINEDGKTNIWSSINTLRGEDVNFIQSRNRLDEVKEVMKNEVVKELKEDFLQFYKGSMMDDPAGTQSTDDTVLLPHYSRLQVFRLLEFNKIPQLQELALAYVGTLIRQAEIPNKSSTLSPQELQDLLCNKLTLVSVDDSWGKRHDFLITVMVSFFGKRQSPKEAISALPEYPNEQIHWVKILVTYINYSAKGYLVLPKLNLQFMMLLDYLRNFNLFHEWTHAIHENIQAVVPLLLAYLNSVGETVLRWWTRMVLIIKDFSIAEGREVLFFHSNCFVLKPLSLEESVTARILEKMGFHFVCGCEILAIYAATDLPILDSAIGHAETPTKLAFSMDTSLSLSANHLYKLGVPFELFILRQIAFSGAILAVGPSVSAHTSARLISASMGHLEDKAIAEAWWSVVNVSAHAEPHLVILPILVSERSAHRTVPL